MRTPFAGTKRFKVIRKLGEGGMGAVYECQDRTTRSRVALKTLLIADAATLLHFKDEFRQFQDIHHHNLVSLGELFEEDGLWCFTMELVEGRDFLSHVRKGVSPVLVSPTDATLQLRASLPPEGSRRGQDGREPDIPKLRTSLHQLTEGLLALHAEGKVHCDVKPSNILVDGSGRVVLLDFGIATDVSRVDQLRRTQALAGTPAYMAPEQAVSMPITPAVDWYAVGCVLFEALTGRLPFEGHYLAIIDEKMKKAAPDPRHFVTGLPDDLATIALDLLATRPEDRLGGEAVLRRLGVEAPSSRSNPALSGAKSVRHDTRAAPFVGRAEQRSMLEDCFDVATSERRAVAVYVQGESGVGKSTLVQRFTDSLAITDPHAIVLSGACYEHETVPYKAVDGLVDALSRYLSRLPAPAASALLPRHAAALAQAFPVLSRVEAFAECPRPKAEIDPVERRSRVFGAFRELLARLGDRAPLVLVIDDLQWADADSFALLGDILRPPESPAFLLVATVRSEPSVRELALPTGPVGLPADGTVIHVPRLDHAEACALVEALTRGDEDTPGADIDVESVAREAQGYPIFLHELVRHHAVRTDATQRPLALEDAIWARIETLDDLSRRLLEVVALAPSAMMQATATRAAGIEGADAIKHIKRLKAAHFVRTTGGTRGTDQIEPYHGRTREAVRAKLSGESRRALHRRIAVVMETSRVHDPEDLAVHWREAGDPERAEEYAQKAAIRAEDALAFDRAAAHYRMIDELGVLRGAQRRALLVRLGDALANAGRSQEAATAFREAAEGASPIEARELARRAAEHLLRSGHIDEGLVELRRVLVTVSLSYPETAHAAIASLLWSRVNLGVRGLSFEPTVESAVPPDVLARIDTCWAATTGLWVVDQLRGIDFHLRHLRMALTAGEPSRAARGLAFHAVATVAEGERKRPDAEAVLALARKHAEFVEAPYTDALVEQADSTVAFLCGDWQRASERSREAVERLRSTCRGVAWELATTRQNLFWSLAFMGELVELTRLTRSNLRETLEAGDHYAAMSIRSGLPNALWLAQGDPARARREAEQAIDVWPREQALLQHLMDLFAQVNIDLYEGKHEQAAERIATVRPKLVDAGQARVEFNRVLLLDVSSRASLARARALPREERRPHLEAARRDIDALARVKARWARALATPKRACLAQLEGDPEAKLHAARAVVELGAAKLHLYAAACAHASGCDAPEAFAKLFERERVKDPDRLAQVFFPGW